MGSGRQGTTSHEQQDAQRGPGFFKGDDDLMVDRLVSVCAAQKKGDSVLLPGFGRDLVPYFVPGTAEPGESEINATLVQKPESRPGSQTSSPSRTSQSTSNLDKRPKRQASKQLRVAPRKLEGALSEAQILKQPDDDFLARAMSSVSKKQRQKSAQAFAAVAKAVSSSQDATKPTSNKSASSKPVDVPACNMNHSSRPSSSGTTMSGIKSMSMSPEKSRWAGGAHANSPSPVSIPLPSTMMHPSSVSDNDTTLGGSVLLTMLGVTSSVPTPSTVTAPTLAAKLLTPAELMSAIPAKVFDSATKNVGNFDPVSTPNQELLAMLRPSISCSLEALAVPGEAAHNLVDAAASAALREMLNF